MKRESLLRTTIALCAFGSLALASSCLRMNQGDSPPRSRPSTEAPQAGSRSHSPASAAVFHIDDGHGLEPIRLSMDKFMTRDRDGKERLQTLSPPATPASLGRRIREIRNVSEAFPVVEGTHGLRLVTSDLRVQSRHPEAIARNYGLSVKEKPAYAPGWAILSAADPLAALHAMEAIRASGDAESVSVLLAVKRHQDTMPRDRHISQ